MHRLRKAARCRFESSWEPVKSHYLQMAVVGTAGFLCRLVLEQAGVSSGLVMCACLVFMLLLTILLYFWIER